MKTLLIKANSMILPRFGGEGYISGVGRSTVALVDALFDAEKNFNIALYSTGLNSYWIKDLKYSCKKYRFLLPQKIGTQLTNIEPFYINRFLKKDLIHIPHNFDVVSKKDKWVVTIHDTCLYDIAKREKNKYLMSLWENSAKNSSGIITCSENSKFDIIDRFHVPEEKVDVVPWGISHDIFYKSSSIENKIILTQLGLYGKYFLSVSCANERKNMFNLFKSFEKFASINTEVSLVVLWSNPPKHIIERYFKLINSKRIIFLPYVTDRELNALYNEALATLFPSRYEGFGFPIIESFACGTPVMTCRNSSLQEIGKDLAVYTGEDDIEQMANIMQGFYEKEDHYNLMSDKFQSYSNTYSWAVTAKAYINFYNKYLF